METGRQIQRGGGGERDRDSVTERDGLGVGWTKKQSLRVRTKPMGTAWRVEGWKEGMAKRANDGPTVVVVIVAVYRFLLLCLALSLSLCLSLVLRAHTACLGCVVANFASQHKQGSRAVIFLSSIQAFQSR